MHAIRSAARKGHVSEILDEKQRSSTLFYYEAANHVGTVKYFGLART